MGLRRMSIRFQGMRGLRKSGGGVAYLLQDMFRTERAAGAVNGTFAEPGPGTRIVVDTENKITISAAGKLTVASGKAVKDWSDPAVWLSTGFARAAGMAMACLFKRQSSGNDLLVGLDNNTDGYPGGPHIYVAATGSTYYNSTIGLLGAFPAAETPIIFILRGTGAFYLSKLSGVWTLQWVDGNSALSTDYFVLNVKDAVNPTVDDVRVGRLPAPWNTDFGIATSNLPGNRQVGDAFTHTADCLMGFTVVTLPSAQSISVYIRGQDDVNNWRVAVAGDGTVSLFEVIDNALTNRGSSGAGAVANGQGVAVIAEGQTIKVYSNYVLRITYALAANFATATAGKLNGLGTGGAVAGIGSYPRRMSGQAALLLDRFTG